MLGIVSRNGHRHDIILTFLDIVELVALAVPHKRGLDNGEVLHRYHRHFVVIRV